MNSSINLKYSEKDAAAVSTALKLGAGKLFGTEKAHIYTLTTLDSLAPTKERIKTVIYEISQKATPDDIILIYLSGHGIAWGGDQGDFYYLTTEATAASAEAYSDEYLRKNYTISTSEFTELLKAIRANKQVMIIDACSSGKAVENLMGKRDIDISSRKAIDRMKDRTGMYVISGSAANAVSYEASLYGQGLLTYAILDAMKGAALDTDDKISVLKMFDHARENVPILAAGLGGIQTPQMVVPQDGTIWIGKMDDEAKKSIPLSKKKPVFVRASFIDVQNFKDHLGLSKLIDNELNEIAIIGSDAPFVFVDAREFPEAYAMSGGYTVDKGIINLTLVISSGDTEKTVSLSANNREDLVDKVMDEVFKLE